MARQMIDCGSGGGLRIRTLSTLHVLNIKMSINQVIRPWVRTWEGTGVLPNPKPRSLISDIVHLWNNATKFICRKSDQKYWTLTNSCLTGHALHCHRRR